MPFRKLITGGGSSGGGSSGGVGTGIFTRNCVLRGKASSEMSYPLYIREPGLISPAYNVNSDGLGYIESSEGTADNALPKHNSNSLDSNYCSISTVGGWIAYHHVERPTTIRGYRFETADGYTPATWTVEGSNDGTTWVTIHNGTAPTWVTGRNVVSETVPEANRAEYKHHRIVFNTFDDSSVRIYTLQFWDALCSDIDKFYLDADAEN